jgi:hypothetical protein
VEGGIIMKKFLTKLLIALALMPIAYGLGIMLAPLMLGIEEYIFSVEQVPTPIAAKPPAQIKAAPRPPAKLEAVYLNREFARPTVGKIEGNVGSEQKPPAPPKKYMCPLEAVYYPDESEFCSHADYPVDGAGPNCNIWPASIADSWRNSHRLCHISLP